MENSLLNEKRLENIRKCMGIIRDKGISGSTAELGVYKGGVSRMIADYFQEKTHYACDTFAGIPDADPEIDKHKNGDFRDVVYDDVRAYLSKSKNIEIVKGIFPMSVTEKMENDKFCLAHFDGDTRASCRNFVKFFTKRMSDICFLIFDDYMSPKTPGVKIGVDEAMGNYITTGYYVNYNYNDGQLVIEFEKK